MNSAHFEATTVFKLSRKGSTENSHDDEDCVQQDVTDSEDPINILCIIHKNDKIGSAYYNFQEKLVGFQYFHTQNFFSNSFL